MSDRIEHPLSNFESFADQEQEDLEYGAQADACRRFAETVPNEFRDRSITRQWTPDED